MYEELRREWAALGSRQAETPRGERSIADRHVPARWAVQCDGDHQARFELRQKGWRGSCCRSREIADVEQSGVARRENVSANTSRAFVNAPLGHMTTCYGAKSPRSCLPTAREWAHQFTPSQDLTSIRWRSRVR